MFPCSTCAYCLARELASPSISLPTFGNALGRGSSGLERGLPIRKLLAGQEYAQLVKRLRLAPAGEILAPLYIAEFGIEIGELNPIDIAVAHSPLPQNFGGACYDANANTATTL